MCLASTCISVGTAYVFVTTQNIAITTTTTQTMMMRQYRHNNNDLGSCITGMWNPRGRIGRQRIRLEDKRFQENEHNRVEGRTGARGWGGMGWGVLGGGHVISLIKPIVCECLAVAGGYLSISRWRLAVALGSVPLLLLRPGSRVWKSCGLNLQVAPPKGGLRLLWGRR